MKAQLFDITHTTTYDYGSPVTVAHHLLRLAPGRPTALVDLGLQLLLGLWVRRQE